MLSFKRQMKLKPPKLVDLEPFDRFLSKIQTDVEHAKAIVETIKKVYKRPEQREYATTFDVI